MSKAKMYHLLWGLFAILSAISFFQVNAYFFDSRGLNWIPIASGILFFILGAIFLRKVIKNSN